MEKALAASGRNILYAICNWGQDSPWDWGPSVGNSWRITGDISDNFNTQNSQCGVYVNKPFYSVTDMLD